MSYLKLPDGVPEFSKAVISLWFRVPQESIIRVATESAAGSSLLRLEGILPLLVFGGMFEGYTVETQIAGHSSYTKSYYLFDGAGDGYQFLRTESYEYATGATSREGETYPVNPSYVGVYCDSDNIGKAWLQIRLQSAEVGHGEWVMPMNRDTISNHSQLVNAVNLDKGQPASDIATDGDECLTGGVVGGGTKFQTRTYVDDTAVWAAQYGPDFIEVGGDDDHRMEIEPDTWHHLLLSFDVSQPTTASGGTLFDAYPCGGSPNRTSRIEGQIDSPCKVWIALDDENYTDEYLAGGLTVDRAAVGLGTNDVAPFNCLSTTYAVNGGLSARYWEVTGLVSDTNWPIAGMPRYQYSAGNLPTSGHELGVPCVSSLVDRNCRVEMAELQIFTDVTLDTGNIGSRRAFVDTEGKPVKPGNAIDLPDEPPGAAEALLGKKPEVLLHGSSHWQDGYNTGTLGVRVVSEVTEGGTVLQKLEKIPSGQFEPVAGIEKYKPEPQLRETTTD